jgi:hypothetical protein
LGFFYCYEISSLIKRYDTIVIVIVVAKIFLRTLKAILSVETKVRLEYKNSSMLAGLRDLFQTHRQKVARRRAMLIRDTIFL